MPPNGLHHITCVTVDAKACVDFYTRLLGLRLVKRTVNQDVPDVWHLFFGDDEASPGMDLTFFEFRGLPRGVPGAGAAHTIIWRVASDQALDFWHRRLSEHSVDNVRDADRVRFADSEGLGHELIIDATGEAQLRATAADIPEEFALLGFDGVRAHSHDPETSAANLRLLLDLDGEGPQARGKGALRSAGVIFEQAPPEPHRQGAGSIHHIAWTAVGGDPDLETWRLRIASTGLRPTPVIDRFWFHSVYFRAPDGLMHEFATPEPGFTVDEPLETLGTKLVLPTQFEPYREQIAARLTEID